MPDVSRSASPPSSDSHQQKLLSSGWVLDKRLQPVVIVLLGACPLISFSLPASAQAWQSLLFGLQAFGAGLFAAQVAPIWTRVRARAEEDDRP